VSRSFLQMLRARRRSGQLYRVPGGPVRLRQWWEHHGQGLLQVGLMLLTLVACLHLIGALVFPAGRNGFFLRDAPQPWQYLTLAPVGDTLGLPHDGAERRFIFYQAYTQDGQVQNGIMPAMHHLSGSRYDRWEAAGAVASDFYPELHRTVLEFVLSELPEPPLRLELYAARWHATRLSGTLSDQPAGSAPPGVALIHLGTYDGLHETWQPNPRPKSS